MSTSAPRMFSVFAGFAEIKLIQFSAKLFISYEIRKFS